MSSRIITSALRVQSQIAKRVIGSGIRSSNFVKSTAPLVRCRNFHQSIINFNSNSNLKSVLKSEIEVSNAIPNELDSSYSSFIKENNFEIIENQGTSTVHLVKKKDGEIIHIFFDVAEITNIPQEEIEEDFEEDNFENEANALGGYFSNVEVIVEKENQGLIMNLLLHNTENSFMIDGVLLQDNIQEYIKNNQSSNVPDQYDGPSFSDLDESLQTEFENYLADKGVTEELAEFIIAYSEFKEEKEYRNWLSNLTKFL